jgi:hypothetical protein
VPGGLGPYQPPSRGGALRQGEIVTGLVQVIGKPDPLITGTPVLELVTPPVSTVLSQNCALETDFAQGEPPADARPTRQVPNVLLCEAVEASMLRGREAINSTLWSRIRSNSNQRYHFLQAVEPGIDAEGESIPELGIHFRRTFTVPTFHLYVQLEEGGRRCCRLVSPYLEPLSTRSAAYLCRIALLVPHCSE